MAATIEKQSSFGAGEISPLLYARAGTDVYAHGLRTCQNFLPTVHGALQNRAGTEFCGTVPTPGGSDDPDAKLAAFTMSDGQTYVLVVCAGVIAVYHDGAPVVYAADVYEGSPPVLVHEQGDPVEITMAWTADFSEVTLHFAQAGDTITITACNHTGTYFEAVQVLTYAGPEDWTIAAKVFVSAASAVAGLAWVDKDTTEDTDHKLRRWEYQVTAVLASTGEETLPCTALENNTGGGIVLGDNHEPARMSWTDYSGADYYNVYKGMDGVFGLQGSTRDNAWADDGTREPDYTRPPPRSGYCSWDDECYAVAYHQQRLVFGRKYQTISASAVGDFMDFDIRYKVNVDQPIELTLGSRFADRIRHLLPMGKGLAVFTESAEYALTAPDGVWGPGKIEASAHSANGASWVVPILADNVALYVQEAGSRVREFMYDSGSEAWGGQDLSFLAEHLVDGRTIIDMAWQADAHTLWCVTDDGLLLSLTYDPRRQIVGWAWHETEGLFEACCVAREDGRDRLYVVVYRSASAVGRRVERFAPRLVDEVRDSIFLDCAITFDGRNTGDTTMGLTAVAPGQGWSYGDEQTLEASVSTFAAGDVGDYIVLGYGQSYEVWCLITGYTSGTVVTVKAQKDVPDHWKTGTQTEWAWARYAFTPTTDPWGSTATPLRALVDGTDGGTVSDASGVVTLDRPAVVVTIGFSYESRAELLEMADARGDIRTRTKNVRRVLAEVYETAGVQAGKAEDDEDDEQLHDLIRREVSAGWGGQIELKTGLYEVTAKNGGWDRGGRVVFVQEAPLPVTLLSVIREVEIGGR